MNRRQFLLGVAAWLAFLAIGAAWISRPVRWPVPPGVTTEMVQREFPIRLARLERGEIEGYMGRLDDEERAELPAFHFQEWSRREARNRGALFFILWMGSGLFVHWFVGRILRGQKDYSD